MRIVYKGNHIGMTCGEIGLVNINNLPYNDRYFTTYWQFEMFNRGKPMDIILIKCIFQNRSP